MPLTNMIEALDAKQLRRELDELDRRRDALRVLYRVALARRKSPPCEQTTTAEGEHA